MHIDFAMAADEFTTLPGIGDQRKTFLREYLRWNGLDDVRKLKTIDSISVSHAIQKYLSEHRSTSLGENSLNKLVKYVWIQAHQCEKKPWDRNDLCSFFDMLKIDQEVRFRILSDMFREPQQQPDSALEDENSCFQCLRPASVPIELPSKIICCAFCLISVSTKEKVYDPYALKHIAWKGAKFVPEKQSGAEDFVRSISKQMENLRLHAKMDDNLAKIVGENKAWISVGAIDISKLQKPTIDEVLLHFHTAQTPTIYCMFSFERDLLSFIRQLKELKEKCRPSLQAKFSTYDSEYWMQLSFLSEDEKDFERAFAISVIQSAKQVYLDSIQHVDETSALRLWSEDSRSHQFQLTGFYDSMCRYIKEHRVAVPLPRRIYHDEGVVVLDLGNFYVEKEEESFIVYQRGNMVEKFSEDGAADGIANLLSKNQ